VDRGANDHAQYRAAVADEGDGDGVAVVRVIAVAAGAVDGVDQPVFVAVRGGGFVFFAAHRQVDDLWQRSFCRLVDGGVAVGYHAAVAFFPLVDRAVLAQLLHNLSLCYCEFHHGQCCWGEVCQVS